MKKRDFLRLTAATGGLALFGNAVSVSRYKSQAHSVKPFELEEVTIPQLQQEMRMGKYSARSLVELYVGRIKELDQQLHSVIELNPDAVAIAESLDAERQAGKVRGMLHGIPILLKDNIDTGDKMTTTAGSLALEGSIAKQDAFLAAQLRKAGAVIV
ncbi:MAG: amidase, partial [Blastocatellia bacterium]|nr:amidase [Blastocatellia bacterium]